MMKNWDMDTMQYISNVMIFDMIQYIVPSLDNITRVLPCNRLKRYDQDQNKRIQS